MTFWGFVVSGLFALASFVAGYLLGRLFGKEEGEAVRDYRDRHAHAGHNVGIVDAPRAFCQTCQKYTWTEKGEAP